MKNFFKASATRSVNQKLALTGVFLSLVILFQFLERYMPFGGTFMNINLSLLFIFPIFFFSGWSFGFIALILRFILGPAIGSGYNLISIIGHAVLLLAGLLATFVLYLYSLLYSKIKYHFLKLVIISISSVLTISLIMTVLNGIIITPLYWSVFTNGAIAPTISAAAAAYPDYKGFFFGIPTYWGGIWAVFMSGNIVKFGIVFTLFIPLSRVIEQTIKIIN